MKIDLKHLFVDYENAKKLKELGFDDPCFAFFNEDYIDNGVVGIGNPKNYNDFSFNKTWRRSSVDDIVSAPLTQQVIEWLREKHNIVLIIDKTAYNYWFHKIAILVENAALQEDYIFLSKDFDNFQKCTIFGIKRALSYIKQ